jgi:hypothetical protein
MKKVVLIALFSIINLCKLDAQVVSDTMMPGDVFVIERWINNLMEGREIPGLWDNSGLVMRFGAGYRHERVGEASNFRRTSAASFVPEIELGLKWHIVEAGFRHSPMGLSLGADQGIGRIYFGPDVITRWGRLATTNFTGGYARLNLRLWDFPFFMSYGRNFATTPNRTRVQIQSDTGGIQIIYVPNVQVIPDSNIRFRTVRWSVGAEYGMFWWSYAIERYNVQLGSFVIDPVYYHSVQAGIQVPITGTPIKKRKPQKGAKYKDWFLSSGIVATHIPFGRNILATSGFAELGYRHRDDWRMSLRIRVSEDVFHGTDAGKVTFRQAPDLPFKVPEIIGRKESSSMMQIAFDRIYHQETPFQPNMRLGLGFYELSKPVPYVDAFVGNPNLGVEEFYSFRPGAFFGYGFDYRLLAVRGVLHVPFARFPPFLELSTGFRLAI